MDTLEKLGDWVSHGDRKTSLSWGRGMFSARLKEYRPETGLFLTVGWGEGATISGAFESALLAIPNWCD